MVVRGKDDRRYGAESAIADRVKAGDQTVTVGATAGLRAGQRVAIRRPSTGEWIRALSMDQFTGSFKAVRLDWLPGSRDVEWEREVVAVKGDRVQLDAPITIALERDWGGGTVRPLTWPGRIRNVGIESLECVSEFDSRNPLDEEHAWMCVEFHNVEDGWVQGVTARQFVSAAVWLGPGTRQISVENCRAEQPVSENGGARRLGFYVGGQLTLVRRCATDQARESFAAGHCAAGPNVFLDCVALRAAADSGPFESWAAGVLYDNVRIEGAGIVLGNLGERMQGAGWNAAQGVIWNCTAGRLRAENPPGAENRVISDAGVPSLYRAQLAKRRALPEASGRAAARPTAKTTAGSSGPERSKAGSGTAPLQLVNGRFTAGGRALFGGSIGTIIWKGQTIPSLAATLGTCITRWAPGRSGPGLTEDLAGLIESMCERDRPFLHAWPGLWYDRRRDDHTTVARLDSEVWAPFLEMPWARSGRGRANDGLSKFDLTKFNPWYWDRLREFASLSAKKGVVMFHYFYDNHNLVENAAHWVDFPWRPANCVQETGFPEPPPITGKNNNWIRVAETFYDVSHPVRRDLHHRLIWHGLDAMAGQANVIHTLGFQFAGPLSFQQFFLDEVAAWRKARGRRVRVGLCTSKAITDAILADPVRGPLVDVIDQGYWQYLPDGTLFAPDGEGKFAFRELKMKAFGKDMVPAGTAELVYRQVREYRDRYPLKAIVCGHAGQGPIPILMAGGAAPVFSEDPANSSAQPRADGALIRFVKTELAGLLARTTPRDDLVADETWCLADEGRTYVFFSRGGREITLARPVNYRRLIGMWFNPRTGETTPVTAPAGKSIVKPSSESWLLLLRLPK